MGCFNPVMIPLGNPVVQKGRLSWLNGPFQIYDFVRHKKIEMLHALINTSLNNSYVYIAIHIRSL